MSTLRTFSCCASLTITWVVRICRFDMRRTLWPHRNLLMCFSFQRSLSLNGILIIPILVSNKTEGTFLCFEFISCVILWFTRLSVSWTTEFKQTLNQVNNTRYYLFVTFYIFQRNIFQRNFRCSAFRNASVSVFLILPPYCGRWPGA